MSLVRPGQRTTNRLQPGCVLQHGRCGDGFWRSILVMKNPAAQCVSAPVQEPSKRAITWFARTAHRFYLGFSIHYQWAYRADLRGHNARVVWG